MDISNNISTSEIPLRRKWPRYPWIPVGILIAAASWWGWQAWESRYQTWEHVFVVLLSLLGISAWYLVCGTARRRTRLLVVAGVWLGVASWFVFFRPVYNGAMGIAKWNYRFAPAADEKLEQIEFSQVAADWQPTSHDYPAFLGGRYWAEVDDASLDTNWKTNPPREVWRREIGGGWSSFAVVGNYAVTQEQRGENEIVSCYRVDTGEPVWTHSDRARFDPADFQGSLGDIGPRATPTIAGEKILTQGGTGIVNCLDARTGEVIWSHNTTTKFGVPVTTWGKSGSPLVVDDMVVISVGALGGNASNKAAEPAKGHDCSLVAFDLNTGKVRWAAGTRPAAYATPVVAELAGERQIMIVNHSWVTSHRASDGEVLWERPWADANDSNASISQAVPVGDDRVLLTKGYGTGASLLQVKRNADGKFSVEPVWTPAIKRVMKTKFSNVVVRNGLVYGLDDRLLSCIELATGEQRWKKRRDPEFGYGQIMLVDDAILVLSETGEVVLVRATPNAYEELASLQALDASNVTWNNPAFSPPYLLVRNAREAACYELPLKK